MSDSKIWIDKDLLPSIKYVVEQSDRLSKLLQVEGTAMKMQPPETTGMWLSVDLLILGALIDRSLRYLNNESRPVEIPGQLSLF